MDNKDEAHNAAMWQMMLTGTHPGFMKGRRLFSHIPADPRCQLCMAPYKGVGGFVARHVFHKVPGSLNPHFCTDCERFAQTFPGGAEVRITMLFADIRGSTSLAENISPSEFTRILNRFYAAATHVLIPTHAWIDKLVGDEVIALFIPAFAGKDHPRVAVDAAQNLLRALGYGTPEEAWLPAGVGIHTDNVFVGSVGSEGVTDITALGDGMNTAARLVSNAGAGEILVSHATYEAGGFDMAGLETRELQLKGRSEPITVHVMTVGEQVLA